MNLIDRLTILIPTYNRKERLLGTLQSISTQGHWGEFDIVIVDNCSNYSVKDAVKESFLEDFTKMISIHRWFFNTGMSTNISIAFEFVKTKWCWFISDDDKILDGALDTVLYDIKRYGDSAAVKYSIKDVCQYDNTVISDVNEWTSYYMAHHSGDKGYLSMLYNISALYPFLSELTIHSYSYLSFWIPVLKAINETTATMVMSSDNLFQYKQNNDGWSSSDERFLDTLLGIRTFFDSRYGFSSDSFCNFKKLYSCDLFNAKSVVLRIVYLSERDKRRHYYNLLKNYLTGNLLNILISKIFYHLILLMNLSPSKIKNFVLYINKYR